MIFRNYLNSLTKRIHKYIMEAAMRKWQHLGQGSHSHKGEGEVGKSIWTCALRHRADIKIMEEKT